MQKTRTPVNKDGFEFDLLAFIGRFQMYHNGHRDVIRQALAKSAHTLVLAGSANRPRSIRNPWTFEERAKVILEDHPDEKWNGKLAVRPLDDIMYNDDAWCRNVQAGVALELEKTGLGKHARVGLIGMAKDGSSYYLKLFPQWESVGVKQAMPFDATTVRHNFLSKKHHIQSEILPDSSCRFLKSFMQTPEYAALVDEGEFLKGYKKSWDAAPYPPIFHTVDAVVTASGQVLMVRRGAQPGKGLMALPGGFVNEKETLEHAVLRELREETGIKVPEKVLKGSIKSVRTFDDPWRSQRGRTITTAYHIELEPSVELPKVKGSDDAASAFWMPIAEIDAKECFEDHWDMLRNLLGQA